MPSAASVCVKADGTGYADLGGVPEARDNGADVLPMEEQVWRNAAERHEAAAATRGRERQVYQLCNGKRFRALTVLDTFSRESLAIYVDKSIKGEQVCDELE